MTARISGRTQLAGIIGWPVEQSLSPAMHNAAYEAMEVDVVYVPLPVPDEAALCRVLSAIRTLPFVGFNVTMPYKQAMLGYCDEVAMLAQMAGAVNAVHCVDGRLIGYNTDGRGLVDSLASETGFEIAGSTVVLIGAGGAAGSALVSLVLGKAGRVVVLNRTLGNAEMRAERVRPHARDTAVEVALLDEGAREIVRSADLVVNATSLGMRPDDPPPVPVEWLRAGQTVADMVYLPWPTPFVAAARAVGARAIDGLGMLVAQGATALEIWCEGAGDRAPRDVMRAAAEAELAGRRVVKSGEVR
ncbi:MAG TPA: shikimate dehydrogenase [Coriobacteriia bacterium]|nr:shikimate dehydrogenase [Coriobacteriia bacterium]